MSGNVTPWLSVQNSSIPLSSSGSPPPNYSGNDVTQEIGQRKVGYAYLVTREPKDNKVLILVLQVQILQSLVLRSEPAERRRKLKEANSHFALVVDAPF
jgi:hypothetical protein